MQDAAEIVRALEKLAPQGIAVGARIITPGDELALMSEELAPIGQAVMKVRRQSGAARIAARALMAKLGIAPVALPRTASGAPRWPAGIVGSLAHDDQVAVAAVAKSSHFSSVGIDVEPSLPLDETLLSLVATRAERDQIAGDLIRARLLFCVKEAVYKAVHPLDRVFLDHLQIEVDFADSCARAGGRTVAFRALSVPRLLAMALIWA